MRERLIELLNGKSIDTYADVEYVADYLLANGVIVPPVKVGDTVYRIYRIVWESECGDCEHYLVGGFGDPSTCGRTRDGYKHPGCCEIEEQEVTQRDVFGWLYLNSFGKTVFLTREEAEKAFAERMKDNG